MHILSVLHIYGVLTVFIFGVKKLQEIVSSDFHGGTVDGNPPVNAGTQGPIPGPGRLHTLQSN